MFFDLYYTSELDFTLRFDDKVFNCKPDENKVRVEYTPIIGKDYLIEICCTNIEVLSKSIVINKLQFDNFWVFEGNKISFGTNTYSQEYLNYVKNKNIDLDLHVSDNNVLFFTGKLIFKFSHPIYKFYEKNPLY